jgi:hypothetical protein
MDLLALYGAAAATVVALWNIHQYRSDRRLLVNVSIGYQPQAPQEKFLTIEVINSGKRPIRPQGIELHKSRRTSKKPSPSQHKQIIPVEWPKTLNEGETFTVIIPNPLFSELFTEDYRFIFVHDSTNKCWNASARNIRKLYKEYKKIEAGGRSAPSA